MNMRHRWATSALWAVLVISKLSLREASASDRAVIGVVTPDTIALGEEVTIRWNYDDGNGGSSGRFDIALYNCHDAFCGQFYCGDFVAEFCDKPEIGCGDSLGDFQITVPNYISSGDGYKIRVGLHGSDLYDCSSTFSIVEEIPVPTLEVFIPTVVEGEWESDYVFDDDSASTVIESTVEIRDGRARALQTFSGPQSSTAAVAGTDTIRVSWKYDDGFGGTFARFNIDLYYCGGGCEYTQNCGEIVATLCESCPDSAGNEAIALPNPYSSYNYKIRVSTADGVSRPVSACSPKFQIWGRDRPGYSTPTPTSSSEPTERLPDPRASLSTPGGDLPATPVIRPTEFPDWGAEATPDEQPDCDLTVEPPSVRYASSTGRIYVERNGTRGGCFTLSDIWDAGNTVSMPLYRIDPSTNRRVQYNTGVWLLTEDLYVRDGVTLQIHGRNKGGDCDELRLSSNSSTLINLRAHGASFSFFGTKVTSWDEGKDTVDHNYENGRSYISAISEVIYDDSETCDGAAKDNMGQARMDVIESEMAYLGYRAAESYGLVWKVRGFCVDKSNPEVFDHVDVLGDIINSNIHDNYFGMYSYGHYGGNWSFNKMHDNVAYGFDPHDDSDYLTIEGNDVWGNGNHGIIASKRCNHVRMLNNHVSWGHQAGLFLHRSTDFAIVRGNHVHDNDDAGLAFLESFYAEVTGNVFKNNKYGVRFSVGSSYNWIYNNVFANSEKYHLFTYLGSDPTDIPGTSGNPTGIVFWRNYLSGTRYQVMKVKESEDLVVVNNRIDGASTMMFVESTNVQYRDNEEEDGLLHIIRSGVCFTEDSTLDPKC